MDQGKIFATGGFLSLQGKVSYLIQQTRIRGYRQELISEIAGKVEITEKDIGKDGA